MSSFKTKLIKELKEKRNISDSSIKMYLIHLEKTNDFLNNKREFDNLDFLKNKKKILDKFFENKSDTFKRNYTASYLSTLSTNKNKYEKLIEFYQKKIKEFQEPITHLIKNHIKTDKQKINMVSTRYLNKIRLDLEKQIKNIDLDEPSIRDVFKYQDYLIASIYTLYPPRRLEDYANMKIITNSAFNNLSLKSKKENNYLVIKNNKLLFIFGDYKTSKSYGIQEFEIKGKLKEILNKWIIVNPTNNFIMKKDRTKINSNGLGKIVKRIFSNAEHPNITVNIIRHSFLSNKYIPKEEDKERVKDSKFMGHSMNLQNQYIKID